MENNKKRALQYLPGGLRVVVTLNYFKNQIKPQWQLKDLGRYVLKFTKH